ncbi:hypothetical protein AB3M80_16425 [Arthrospira platensis BEA 1257B]
MPCFSHVPVGKYSPELVGVVVVLVGVKVAPQRYAEAIAWAVVIGT